MSNYHKNNDKQDMVIGNYKKYIYYDIQYYNK